MQDVGISRLNTICTQYYNSVSRWKQQFMPLCIFLFFFFFPLVSRDTPCTMSLIEIKSLFRMDDIIASATQPITILELSAYTGEGLREVLSWLESVIVKWTIICLFLLKWCYSHRTFNDDCKPFGKRCEYHPCAKTPFLRGFNDTVGLIEKCQEKLLMLCLETIQIWWLFIRVNGEGDVLVISWQDGMIVWLAILTFVKSTLL